MRKVKLKGKRLERNYNKTRKRLKEEDRTKNRNKSSQKY